MTKGAHSEHDAASLLREVMHAVAYLHGHSIIHFDIKPENILVRRNTSKYAFLSLFPLLSLLPLLPLPPCFHVTRRLCLLGVEIRKAHAR